MYYQTIFHLSMLVNYYKLAITYRLSTAHHAWCCCTLFSMNCLSIWHLDLDNGSKAFEFSNWVWSNCDWVYLESSACIDNLLRHFLLWNCECEFWLEVNFCWFCESIFIFKSMVFEPFGNFCYLGPKQGRWSKNGKFSRVSVERSLDSKKIKLWWVILLEGLPMIMEFGDILSSICIKGTPIPWRL